ncbi:flippase [Candidatus Chloroploca asiatica]|uniref:Uncharacterized protein n=1 Tax=Candidatus Chloroploca asiatica TaxID=1506545 RepID=A0A2H3KFU0_9CHLR|nr:flippase [Candidatus Chloroploca asiatica]PDV96564.1 hypothetical protein A9Q02_06300 [Candidatus Chloroploca asiatica]
MSHSKEVIFKNARVMLASQLITWMLTLVFSIIMRRFLGPEGSGHIVIAMSIWSIMGVFIGFGMDILLAKEIARDRDRAAELLGTSYFIRFVFYVISVGLVYWYSVALKFTPDIILLIQVVGLMAFLFQLSSASSAALQGLETMEYISLSEIVSKFAHMVLGITVLMLGFRELAVAMVMTTTALLMFLMQAYFLYRYHQLTPRVRLAASRTILTLSLPYVATIFGMVAYDELSIQTLSIQLDATEVGWYGASMQIFGALLFGAVIFNTVTFPPMARAHKTNPEGMPALLRRSLSLILMLSVPIGFGVFAVADQFIHLLFGAEFAPSGDILQVLGFAVIFMYLNTLFGQYFVSIDRQHIWTMVMIVTALMIVPLNFLFVPWSQRVFGIGAIGGAFSFLVTQVGQVVAGWFLVPRGTLDGKTIIHSLKVVAVALIMLLCVWPFRDLFLAIPILIGAIVYPTLIVLLRVIAPDDLQMVIDFVRSAVFRLRKPGADTVN